MGSTAAVVFPGLQDADESMVRFKAFVPHFLEAVSSVQTISIVFKILHPILTGSLCFSSEAKETIQHSPTNQKKGLGRCGSYPLANPMDFFQSTNKGLCPAAKMWHLSSF